MSAMFALSVPNLLACIAGAECVCASALAIVVCQPRPTIRGARQTLCGAAQTKNGVGKTRSGVGQTFLSAGESAPLAGQAVPVDNWSFVSALRVNAFVMLPIAWVFVRFRDFYGPRSQDHFLIVMLTFSLAIFCSLEFYAAWKAMRAFGAYGARWKLIAAMLWHLALMELFGLAATENFGQDSEISWIHTFWPIDFGYVYLPVWLSVMLATMGARVAAAFARPPWTRRIVLAVWMWTFAGALYAGLFPLHGRYLAMFDSSRYGPRRVAVARLAPYLSSETLARLPPGLWEEATVRDNRLGDPVFMKKLRDVARVSPVALWRLWTFEPDTARSIAAEILRGEPKDSRWIGSYAGVLFLEQPDHPIFKQFMPLDDTRRALSDLLFRLSVREIPTSAGRNRFFAELNFHRLSWGFSEVQSSLEYKDEKSSQWFTHNGHTVPNELIPDLIRFLVFIDPDNHNLLLNPNMVQARLALQAQFDRPNWNFKTDWVLWYDIPYEIEVEALQHEVNQRGEKVILKEFEQCWSRISYDPTYFAAAEKILTRWNEVVPGAPTLQTTGGGKAAIDAFLLARIQQLQAAPATAAAQ